MAPCLLPDTILALSVMVPVNPLALLIVIMVVAGPWENKPIRILAPGLKS